MDGDVGHGEAVSAEELAAILQCALHAAQARQIPDRIVLDGLGNPPCLGLKLRVAQHDGLGERQRRIAAEQPVDVVAISRLRRIDPQGVRLARLGQILTDARRLSQRQIAVS